jgi:hypothetical protein
VKGRGYIALGLFFSATIVGVVFGIPLMLKGIHDEMCEIETAIKTKEKIAIIQTKIGKG